MDERDKWQQYADECDQKGIRAPMWSEWMATKTAEPTPAPDKAAIKQQWRNADVTLSDVLGILTGEPYDITSTMDALQVAEKRMDHIFDLQNQMNELRAENERLQKALEAMAKRAYKGESILDGILDTLPTPKPELIQEGFDWLEEVTFKKWVEK